MTTWMCSRTANENDNVGADCVVSGRLDSLFSSIFTSDDEPGAYVLLVKNDTVVYRFARGLANLETKEHIDEHTRFNFASASKIFSAVALLKLSERGLINLDDSLSFYFPEFSDNFFKYITIRNILTHSSGLPDLRPHKPDEWSNYVKETASIFANNDDYRLYGTESEHIKCFKSIKSLMYPPGTRYTRNDPAYILVAPLIERVTGEFFDKWMRDNIFRPASVENICYINPGKPVPASAHGYRKVNPKTPIVSSFKSKDGVWEEYDYGEAPFFITKADRGAFITPEEFVKWKRAYYGLKVLGADLFKEVFNPHIAIINRPNASFGLGCAVFHPGGQPLCEYHLDNNGGFACMEGSYPDEKLHYVVFSNRNDWDYYHVTDEMRRILADVNYLD